MKTLWGRPRTDIFIRWMMLFRVFATLTKNLRWLLYCNVGLAKWMCMWTFKCILKQLQELYVLPWTKALRYLVGRPYRRPNGRADVTSYASHSRHAPEPWPDSTARANRGRAQRCVKNYNEKDPLPQYLPLIFLKVALRQVKVRSGLVSIWDWGASHLMCIFHMPGKWGCWNGSSRHGSERSSERLLGVTLPCCVEEAHLE